MARYNDNYRQLKGFPRADFYNKHDEHFILFRIGPGVYMTGDETDWDVVPLFNRDFDVFSREELIKVGQALIELGMEK